MTNNMTSLANALRNIPICEIPDKGVEDARGETEKALSNQQTFVLYIICLVNGSRLDGDRSGFDCWGRLSAYRFISIFSVKKSSQLGFYLAIFEITLMYIFGRLVEKSHLTG